MRLVDIYAEVLATNIAEASASANAGVHKIARVAHIHPNKIRFDKDTEGMRVGAFLRVAIALGYTPAQLFTHLGPQRGVRAFAADFISGATAEDFSSVARMGALFDRREDVDPRIVDGLREVALEEIAGRAIYVRKK